MTNYNNNDKRFDGRCFLEDVEIKLQKRLEEIEQSLSDGQKEIDNMQEYYWENYTEMDEYGYEDYDNQQALLHQVNANNEKLQLKQTADRSSPVVDQRLHTVLFSEISDSNIKRFRFVITVI